MVKNQIPNLTIDLSYDHNSCISSINEQCKPVLASTFQDLSNDIMRALFGVFFVFNQGFKHSKLLNECNSQNGSALGSHWAPFLTRSPICESVFHTLSYSLGLMGPCTTHLVAYLMLGLRQQYS